ncbi:hypothetical protein SAY86_019367 [Trapa natans]|uniref:Poor homologous synapsis 1 PH domain-containing protein n=1 Tax=Trapa natans TaxID=22666 RepID=A0AAN7LX95_TRANT|nr:hypothetical protein SAY86_019367 [Trapa natans]
MGGSVLSLPRPLHFSHLVPLRKRRKKCTWLSSVSLASLQLLESSCEEGAILTVFLGEKMTEEHFISKLHFTWPHVSCMSRFPARGSRAVFVSYRDCAGEVDFLRIVQLKFGGWRP